MQIVIECTAAEFAKIRWDVVDLAKRRDWRGSVVIHDGSRVSEIRLPEAPRCRSCAAFKAHRTMRKARKDRFGFDVSKPLYTRRANRG